MIEQEELSEKQVGHIENYNPVSVNVTETTGILALSIIVLILLVALLRAQRQIQDLRVEQMVDEEL
ncbi:MAG: hypothetical protein R3293_29095 [Candidatus Promineifilaceae bacterium]|nr:hypothetical protein [Candidatus Promineifilaceae bacterium]